MNSITRNLAYAYVVVCSWSGVAVAVEWITVPVVLLCLVATAFLLCLLSCRIPFDDEVFGIEDIFLSLLLSFWLASALFNPNEKSLYYIALYLFTFGIGYWLLKLVLFGCTSFRGLMYANLVGIIISASFADLDTLLFHLFSIDLQAVIPRVKEATAFFGGIFRRSYGLAPEPTVLAYYLNVLGPLAMWFLWFRCPAHVVTRIILTVVVVFAWLVTLSVAGYLFLLFAMAATAALRAAIRAVLIDASHPKPRGSWSKAYTAIGVVASVGLLISLFLYDIDTGVGSVGDKMQFVDPLIQKASFVQSASANQRLERWSASITAISEQPVLGQGAGYFSSRNQSSSINWYLFLGAEAGLMAVAAAFLFVISCLWQIANSRVAWRWAALVGGIAGALHFGVIATVQHPALWVLFAISKVGIRKDSSIRDKNPDRRK